MMVEISDKKYEDILKESHKFYLEKTFINSNNKWLMELDGVDLYSGVRGKVYRQLSFDEYIDRIKSDPEFSEMWGLEISERELTYCERYKLWFGNNYETGLEYSENNKPDFDNSYYHQTPTKLIILKYNNEEIKFYQ